MHPEKISGVIWAHLPGDKKDTQWLWRGSLPTSSDSRREASSSGQLPSEQPGVAIPLQTGFSHPRKKNKSTSYGICQESEE